MTGAARSRLAALALALALAPVAGCGDGGGGGEGDRPAGAKATATPAPTEEAPAAEQDAAAEDVVTDLGGPGGFDPQAIYRQRGPGVVTIISLFEDSGGLGAILGGDDDGGGGQGSGFVVNQDGDIVTNAHVVTTEERTGLEEADQVFVSFADGNRVPAEIRGYDPNSDIALLTIDPQGLDLQPLPLGSDEDVEVGEPVVALGSPFGADQSLSIGVVSAVDRSVDSLNAQFKIAGAVQTDAAINPGNSGGPLLDATGRVIGINQQIQTRSGGNEGVGFAVPVDLAKRAVDQLREDGEARYAYLGVSTTEVYPQLAERFDLPVERGAWVAEVPDGGPAARAGLRAGSGREVTFQGQPYSPGGDVIVRVAGQEVVTPDDVAEAIALRDPGERIDLVLYRAGEQRTVKVRLGERPLGVRPRTGG